MMRWLIIAILQGASLVIASAQSVEQQFPTPVRNSEIVGTIDARQIGDARLTTYYYTFSGSQGDLFLNIVTTNLNADIDLFIEQGLRPLSKVVVYADRGETETGRVVYLRKPEKLLLRVQGRTPNDESGTFRLKFAGSFVAAASDIEDSPERPRVPVDNARSRQEVAEGDRRATEMRHDGRASGNDPISEPAKERLPAAEAVSDIPRRSSGDKRSTESAERAAADEVVSSNKTGSPARKSTNRSDIAEGESSIRRPANPMASFTLVVLFRDGSRLDLPMVEVSRFLVNDGVLTIHRKNNAPSRYSMTDVLKVSIE